MCEREFSDEDDEEEDEAMMLETKENFITEALKETRQVIGELKVEVAVELTDDCKVRVCDDV